MSLNESPDCKIEKIFHADEKKVVARVTTCLKKDQMQYFLRNQDYLTTDLHSTKARLGINQQKLSSFELKDDKITYEARFWFYIPEYAVGMTIDQLLNPGLEVSKVYLRNPELKYSAEELINLISNRTIIVPKGTKVLAEGILEVPVMPFVHPPNFKVLTQEYLKAAIQKRIPREDLYFAQPEKRVDKVIVPASSGVITHTSLFTQQNEIYILDPEHADARVGSRHTNGIIYLELIGSGKDIVKETAHIEVYKPAYNQQAEKRTFFIDLKSAMLTEIYRKEKLNNHMIAVVHDTGQQRLIRLNEKFDTLLKDLKPNSSLILQDFPDGRLASYFIVAADLGLLKNMTFLKAPEENFFFRSKDLVFMDTLQEMGVGIYWKNPVQGDLVLHNRFFMKSSIIPSFNEAFGSRKLAAIYGTAGDLDPETQKEIKDTTKSFKDFHGGICGILTGGSAGGIMAIISEITAALGMLCGAVYWKIPGMGINTDVDFAMYLGRDYLLERQEILSDTTEADIYFKGGVGTNLESAITFVKKKLGIGYYKPQIFVGDFYKPLQELLYHISSEKMVDPKVFENCYFIKHGAEIFETLCNHFGSEDKMIHEVSVDNSLRSK
ncbi:MAG: LOG family protein [Deltaproteobacteria bacterium]|nr:LOG family protein [Deltaproteobacteria bacterium]